MGFFVPAVLTFLAGAASALAPTYGVSKGCEKLGTRTRAITSKCPSRVWGLMQAASNRKWTPSATLLPSF